MDQHEQILILAEAIEAVFTSSNWTELGYITGTHEYITNHPRLLRSLEWGDDDYKGCVIRAVAKILEADEENLRKIVAFEPISSWLAENKAASLASLQARIDGRAVPNVKPTGSRTALEALADADELLKSRGPVSTVDRVHTGLHGFLKDACVEASISTEVNANANQLLKALLGGHPAFTEPCLRREVRQLLKTSASIVNAMGTLRNNASLAHPNKELLDQEEALFVLNLGRSLLTFLDSKIKQHYLATKSTQRPLR